MSRSNSSPVVQRNAQGSSGPSGRVQSASTMGVIPAGQPYPPYPRSSSPNVTSLLGRDVLTGGRKAGSLPERLDGLLAELLTAAHKPTPSLKQTTKVGMATMRASGDGRAQLGRTGGAQRMGFSPIKIRETTAAALSSTPDTGGDGAFNLAAAKQRVYRVFSIAANRSFNALFRSPLVDAFLHNCTFYFAAKLQIAEMFRQARMAEQQQVPAFLSSAAATRVTNPAAYVPTDVLDALCAHAGLPVTESAKAVLDKATCEALAETYLAELGRLYAKIVLENSQYRYQTKDQVFFELFYDATDKVLLEAFRGNRSKDVQVLVDEELGRIFRTEQFNFARRNRKDAERQTLMLDLREAHRLKYHSSEARDLAKRASLLAAMAVKPYRCSVGEAIASRSPILTQFIPPPPRTPSLPDRPATSPAVLGVGGMLNSSLPSVPGGRRRAPFGRRPHTTDERGSLWATSSDGMVFNGRPATGAAVLALATIGD